MLKQQSVVVGDVDDIMQILDKQKVSAKSLAPSRGFSRQTFAFRNLRSASPVLFLSFYRFFPRFILSDSLSRRIAAVYLPRHALYCPRSSHVLPHFLSALSLSLSFIFLFIAIIYILHYLIISSM